MRCDWLMGVALLISGCDSSEVVRVEGLAMGMSWQAQVVGGEAEQVEAELTQILERWEQAVSLWREDSELVRFNQKEAGVWVAVGEELWAAVSLAREVAEMTEGALDITVGPLVALWGFGPERSRSSPPAEAEIQAVKQRCGWSLLERDASKRSLKKVRADLALNVNAVVEGLVLEEIGQRLEELGYRDFLIELGGELLARGRSPGGRPWVVGIQGPGGAVSELFSTLPLEDAVLATSGTYRHQWLSAGKPYSHLIDPRSGHPVAHALTSVSVVHDNGGYADGLATALLVLGPEQGRAVAERLRLRVFWITAAE